MGETQNDRNNSENLPARQEERSLNLQASNTQIDLSGLSDEQVQALKAKHAEKAIETRDREARLITDVQALGASMRTLGDNTVDLAEKGIGVTVTNVRDDNLGRTEIIMGTSDAAKSGKLSRSQKGLGDPTLMWMGFAIAILIILVVLFAVLAG